LRCWTLRGLPRFRLSRPCLVYTTTSSFWFLDIDFRPRYFIATNYLLGWTLDTSRHGPFPGYMLFIDHHRGIHIWLSLLGLKRSSSTLPILACLSLASIYRIYAVIPVLADALEVSQPPLDKAATARHRQAYGLIISSLPPHPFSSSPGGRTFCILVSTITT
jgi:hypothetical protein